VCWTAGPGVADDTRQAVLTGLDALGYERPSRLRRKSAGLVGLVVPELTNPIFPAFAQVIERALARHGYTPVLCAQTPGGVHEDDWPSSTRSPGSRHRAPSMSSAPSSTSAAPPARRRAELCRG
jgi:hypothetical protein